MNIYQRIVEDHKMIRSFIDELMQTSHSQIEKRNFLFQQLERLFIAHTNAKEQTLYQALLAKENDEAERKVLKARKEHDLASDLLEDLKSTSLESEKFLLKLEQLKVILEEHMDEEEDEIFEIAADLLSIDEESLMSEEIETYEEGINPV